ncbi:hypothetical protein EBZ02_09680, partial [bacterium]|nr:hypothetical protein [bacterium]
EEVTKRFGIHVTAAEKQRKFEYIELLNDALRTKRFFAKRTSRFAEDCRLVEWDRDNKDPEGKLKIKDIMLHQAGLFPFIPFYKKTLIAGQLNPYIYSKTKNSFVFVFIISIFANLSIALK